MPSRVLLPNIMLILWWGDVDHHGLGLFRHLEEGLAASLYLVDGP
jgi:hypothetical protein